MFVKTNPQTDVFPLLYSCWNYAFCVFIILHWNLKNIKSRLPTNKFSTNRFFPEYHLRKVQMSSSDFASQLYMVRYVHTSEKSWFDGKWRSVFSALPSPTKASLLLMLCFFVVFLPADLFVCLHLVKMLVWRVVQLRSNKINVKMTCNDTLVERSITMINLWKIHQQGII
jgi:hypothetical protein